MELIVTLLNCLIFLLLAALHLYWVFGGKWGMDAAIPTQGNGKKLFRPGRLATLVVALGLIAFAVINLAHAGWVSLGIRPQYLDAGLLVISLIFLFRAVGDFRYLGFTKRHRQSLFAKRDTFFYSPLCLVLGAFHLFIFLY
ncbi:DUF3995 domain-containing protein [Chitinophaga sp. MM2321]|uniref:DUF3995 domain-containing protein n=1 Tax=Chitinophaga sp. MM2321 TaxID=3137178 RepID=UPI0032D5A5C7